MKFIFAIAFVFASAAHADVCNYNGQIRFTDATHELLVPGRTPIVLTEQNGILANYSDIQGFFELEYLSADLSSARLHTGQLSNYGEVIEDSVIVVSMYASWCP